MATGTVDWFSTEKNFGFVTQDGAGQVLLPFAEFAKLGVESLEAGQKLEFEVISGPKGPQADNVRLVS
ncbi:cold shock domain-containing protein [Streptomyces sp. NPDC001581]|uniref:cold-shock protein n=1 Tax=Streptomyces sp. NPDC001581 TaxID=3154386 RepID=UPI00331A2CF3